MGLSYKIIPKLSTLYFIYFCICISITPLGCGCCFFRVLNRCFKSLGPWCNGSYLISICIPKISLALHATKIVMRTIRVVPTCIWIKAYFSSPQYFVTLGPSYSINCRFFMASWSMTPIKITHTLATPLTLIELHRLKVKHQQHCDLNSWKLLHQVGLILAQLKSSSTYLSYIPHSDLTCSSPKTISSFIPIVKTNCVFLCCKITLTFFCKCPQPCNQLLVFVWIVSYIKVFVLYHFCLSVMYGTIP